MNKYVTFFPIFAILLFSESVFSSDKNSAIGLVIGTFPTYGVYFNNSFVDRGYGLYFDIQSSRGSVPDEDVYSFTESYAQNVLGDSKTGTVENSTFFTGGVTLPADRAIPALVDLELMLALAIGSKTTYSRYHDATGILGTNNTYFIKTSTNTIAGGSVGLIYSFEKWNIRLSFDSIVSQTSLGLGFRF